MKLAAQNTTIKEYLLKAKQSLQSSDFDTALKHSQDVLNASGRHREALYIKAAAQRYKTDHSAALETLAKLKSIYFEYGRAFQEEGYNFQALGDESRALTAFSKATELNPGLEASWRAQAEILKSRGRNIEAANAQGFYDRLKSLPPVLHSVTNLIYEGELARAEQLCKRFLQNNKTHIEGMRLLAMIAKRVGAHEDANLLYETALDIAPGNIILRMDYIEFLRATHKPDKAVKHAQYLQAQHPNNPMLQNIYAVQSMLIGDYDTAFKMFDMILKTTPNNIGVLLSKGHALKTTGQQDLAIETYQKAYNIMPNHGDAYFSLSNLKTYRFSKAEIKAMQYGIMLQRDDLQNQAHFHFALGKAYEDLQDFAAAFSHYKSGNAAKYRLSRYNADKMQADMQAQIEHCSAALFKQKQGGGFAAKDPIFIVGLPRAGSTLLEQILASHSQIDGTLELPNILTLANQLRGHSKNRTLQDMGGNYPANLKTLTADTLESYGRNYIKDTKIHRQEAPFFIDKMPNNFRHIGLIHLILPNAKIIDARRHPMACCFSGFKQHFAEGQNFSYQLEDMGRYYRDYVKLMHHWDKVLPGKVLRVHYEHIVTDLETQVRRLLDYLELPFEIACVDFYHTKRSVRTASSEQVRSPIFKSGLEQWRNFEPWLDPLKHALGPTLETYDADITL